MYLGNEYSFDFIQQIILSSQQNCKLIKDVWPQVINFLIMKHPENIKDEFGKDIHGDLDKVNFKPKYLLDSYNKIYNQIYSLSIRQLKKCDIIPIIFYKPSVELLKNKTNVIIGDKNEQAISISSGEEILLTHFEIDWKQFIRYYSQVNN